MQPALQRRKRLSTDVRCWGIVAAVAVLNGSGSDGSCQDAKHPWEARAVSALSTRMGRKTDAAEPTADLFHLEKERASSGMSRHAYSPFPWCWFNSREPSMAWLLAGQGTWAVATWQAGGAELMPVPGPYGPGALGGPRRGHLARAVACTGAVFQ